MRELYLTDHKIGLGWRKIGKQEDTDVQPHVYSITSFSHRLQSIGPDNYFTAKASVATDKGHVQIGQMADGRIIVSDKTLWQQVFR